MKSRHLIFPFILIIGLNGCVPFNLADHLEYNESVELFEYPLNEYNSVFIRNEGGEVTDQDNINSFKLELEKNNYKYSFDKCFENDALKASDYTISRLYSDINSDIKNHNFKEAKEGLEQLEDLYPDIKKFSDYLFLESLLYAKTDSVERAKESFNDFLRYSSGSYSGKMRGYRDADINDSIFSLQRKYAKNYLKNPGAVSPYNIFKKTIPKYHYNCFKPGYLINPENYDRGVKWITSFVVGLDVSNYFSLGYFINHNLTEGVDATFFGMGSHESFTIGGGLPVQIYKSPDNRSAIKLTPFVDFMHTDSVEVDDVKYEFDESFFNFGVKISVGYYFSPKLSAGAYYKYNFRNESNPVVSEKYDLYLWKPNEYDISLYYDIFKNISLKTGVYNGDFIGGVFLSGWEIDYNFTSPGLVLKVDMY